MLRIIINIFIFFLLTTPVIAEVKKVSIDDYVYIGETVNGKLTGYGKKCIESNEYATICFKTIYEDGEFNSASNR